MIHKKEQKIIFLLLVGILLIFQISNSDINNSLNLKKETKSKSNSMDKQFSVINPYSQYKLSQQSNDIYKNSNYFFLSIAVTWEQAKTFCEALDMHLVTISDAEENAYVKNLASGENIWIGLSDVNEEGVFEWVNSENLVYTNWAEGQPDNFGIGQNQVYMDSSGTWIDHGIPENPSFVLQQVCEAEFSSSELGFFNDSYYEYFEILLSWEDAITNCEERFGHLVTITSEEENNFVNSLVNDNNIWLGFTDDENEGIFVWITGEEVNYTNWAFGEPNNGGNGEDFTIMWPGGVWNDWDTPSFYVCESGNIDGDSFPDYIEYEQGLDPYVNDDFGDLDNDGISNIWEYEMGLDLGSNDSDGDLDQDGLTNLEEFDFGSSPLSNDTDLDGMDDFWEYNMGLDLLQDDSQGDKDFDLISNIVEYNENTDANNLWSVPVLKSDFPFFYLSVPVLVLPFILIAFIAFGGLIGVVAKKYNMKKLVIKTNSPNYETALLVKKGKFVDYTQYRKAKEFNMVTLKDYELALELKEREKMIK